MEDLRAKCPWDKKQTMQTLRHLTIEETYELGDAILDNDLQEIKKELSIYVTNYSEFSVMEFVTTDKRLFDIYKSLDK